LRLIAMPVAKDTQARKLLSETGSLYYQQVYRISSATVENNGGE